MQEIDLALEQLDDIIAAATKENPKVVYFATLHRRSTLSVLQGILEGRFEDGERMARLERTMVAQYHHAYEAFRLGNTLPQAWEIAFSAARNQRGSLLQHLLLGMNAHLFLDLGVAAAITMKQDLFSKLERDFALRNEMLFAELEPKNNGFGRFARVVGLFDSGMCTSHVWLARQGRRQFRESSWSFAKKLSELDPAYWAGAISDRDSLVAELSWTIRAPTIRHEIPLLLSRFFEHRRI